MKIIEYSKTVFRYAPLKVFALVGCMLIAGALEGISFTLFVPLIKLMTGAASGIQEGSGMVEKLFGAAVPSSMLALLLLIFAVFGAKNLFLYFQKWYAAKLSLEFEKTMKRGIIESVLGSGWKFYTKEKAGTLINVIGSQARLSADAFRLLSFLCLEALNVVIYCVIGFMMSPPAFLMSLAAGALCLYSLRGIVGKSRVIGNEAVSIKNDCVGNALEDFTAIKFIKGNRLEEYRKKDLFGLFEKLYRVEMRGEKFAALMDTLPDFIMAGVVCSILYVSYAVIHVPGENLLVLIMVLYRMNRRLLAVQNYRQRFLLYLPAFELCSDIMRRASATRPSNGSRTFERLEQGVRFQDVTFSYDAQPVLSALTMEIKKNALTAVVGRSGAGKTTMLDLTLGLLEPTSGTVKVDGTDLREYDLFSWRENLSYVPQDAILVNGTIADNIRMGRALSDDEVQAAAKVAYADEFILRQVDGYATLVGDRGLKLSGGQRQRIALARALARKPQILILDEATSALDGESERMVQRAIEGLRGKLTLLVVAHRMSTIEHADIVYVLDEGRIKESGWVEQLKKDSTLFQQLYDIR